MYKTAFLTLLGALSFWILPAQLIVFDVIDDGDTVGLMTVKRSTLGEKTHLESDGIITVSLIWTFELRNRYYANFEDGKLVNSKVRNSRNDDLTAQADGTLSEERYLNTVDGEKRSVPAGIDYILLSMYFDEPVGRTQAYSERQGVYLPIKALGNHQYELTTYAGRPAIYTYVEGRCEQIQLSHLLGSVTFVRR
ncbi:MAG: DUF6134 family protein [Bacteroidota bacterium]